MTRAIGSPTLLGVQPHELVFTSSGTESNNLAILGLARAHRDRGRHLICASDRTSRCLARVRTSRENERVSRSRFLPVSDRGRVDPDELNRAIRDDTILVSIMTANNETGVLQPMEELANLCHDRGVLLHSDMVQSFGKVETRLGESRIGRGQFCRAQVSWTERAPDCFICAPVCRSRPSSSAARMKISAGPEPKTCRRSREWQRRRNGFCAIALASRSARERCGIDCGIKSQNLSRQRPRMATPSTGSPIRSTSVFAGLSSETILMALDLEGVCASSGSACMVGSVVASHVLLAMGLPESLASSAVRFSLGHETTEAEIERAGDIIARVIDRMSSAKLERERPKAYAVA